MTDIYTDDLGFDGKGGYQDAETQPDFQSKMSLTVGNDESDLTGLFRKRRIYHAVLPSK